MLRRIQHKEVESKKLIEKAASKAAADNELNAEEVDLLELERIRKRQAGTQVIYILLLINTKNDWFVLL